MKNMWKPLVLVLCITGFILLEVFYMVPHRANMDITYEGQKTFLVEEDYEEFKKDFKVKIHEDDLRLVTFDVLASGPPIIVNFAVETPYNYYLPYGSSDDRVSNVASTVLLSIVMGVIIIFVPMVLMKR